MNSVGDNQVETTMDMDMGNNGCDFSFAVAEKMNTPIGSLDYTIRSDRSSTTLSEKAANSLSSKRSKYIVLWTLFILVIAFVVSTVSSVYSVVSVYKGTFFSPEVEPTVSNWILMITARLMIYIFIWVTMAPFAVLILSYCEEPELWLPDYMSVDQFPTVDIFLPRYKESWSMYKETVMAALNLDYPVERFMVHVCDDGARSTSSVEGLISELMGSFPNLRYHRRPDGVDAKAGNLNNALLRATGTLLSVLDADHCCEPTFLLRTIPHLLGQWMDGSRASVLCNITAFVQTTQVFKNEKDLIVQVMDGAHQLFYNLIMNCMNGMGISLCVGTGYVMQRRALDSVGGYATGFSVEDVITGVRMHGSGWTSKYLECREVIGLSPETLSEFFQQRGRWAAGSAQLFVYEMFNHTKNMTFRQMFGYIGCCWYWLTSCILVFILTIRLGLGMAHQYIYPSSTLWVLPTLTDYLPVIIMIFLLPRVTIRGKIASLTNYISFVPTYLPVIWGWMNGRLNPSNFTYKVKSSAESMGEVWPKLASLGLGYVVAIVVGFGVSLIPSLEVYTRSVQYVTPLIFMVCTIIVNAGILITAFRCVRGYICRTPVAPATCSLASDV